MGRKNNIKKNYYLKNISIYLIEIIYRYKFTSNIK
jgi:hypothetical protein